MNNANLQGCNLGALQIDTTRSVRSDLSGARLRYADLSGSKLRRANLVGADLSFANLLHADLREADLTRAALTGARLRKDQLESVILTGVSGLPPTVLSAFGYGPTA